MTEFIRVENVVVKDHVENWQEALRLATQPLIDGGYVENRYLDAIFKHTETFGPYYVLGPNVAMPHAGVDDGVIAQQLSLLVLKKPVKFSPNGYDVRLVFVLATPNNHAHLQMLRVLAGLFEDEPLLNRIMDALSPSDIVNDLNANVKKGE